MPKAQRATVSEQKFALVREEILRAAAKLFAARGYRAVTIDDIADAIGFTKSAMYYYFENKYDLLSFFFRESFAHYLKHARTISLQKKGPAENLRSLVMSHSRNALEMREWTMIYFRDESELNDKDRAYVKKCRREYTDLFAQNYAAGVKAGVFKDLDPMTAVAGIIGACNAVAIRHRPDDTTPLEDVAATVADLLSAGYEIQGRTP